MRFLILLLCAFVFSLANNTTEIEKNQLLSKNASTQDLYLSYEEIPEKLYKNQVFTLTVKVVNTNQSANSFQRTIASFDGIKLLKNEPTTLQKDYITLDTYYLQATKTRVKTPDFYYQIDSHDENESSSPQHLAGKYIHSVALKAPSYFSQILAKSFSIQSSKTTHYDATHNIVVFSAVANFANLNDFNLSGSNYQGFESYNMDNLEQSRMTYFIVTPKTQKKLYFSYFNLQTNSYQTLYITLALDDDSVSTQMDITPTEYTHTFIKIVVASAVGLLGILLFIIKRKKRYFFMIALTPIAYIVWVYFPKAKINIEPNTNIYLLPMKHATIFEQTTQKITLTKLGQVDNYNKVLLDNNTIGWVKNENISKD